MSTIKFRLIGKEQGPFDVAQVRKFLAMGLIFADTPVQVDDGQWTRADACRLLTQPETLFERLWAKTEIEWPRQISQSVAILMLACCGLAWLIGNDSEGPLAWIGAAGTIFLALSLARNKWNRKLDFRYVLFAALALFGAWARLSTYWTPMHIDMDTQGAVMEQRSRWTNLPVAQRIYTFAQGGPGIESGPISPSGKRHGYWTISNIIGQPIRHQWYWQGEAVSEEQFDRGGK